MGKKNRKKKKGRTARQRSSSNDGCTDLLAKAWQSPTPASAIVAPELEEWLCHCGHTYRPPDNAGPCTVCSRERPLTTAAFKGKDVPNHWKHGFLLKQQIAITPLLRPGCIVRCPPGSSAPEGVYGVRMAYTKDVVDYPYSRILPMGTDGRACVWPLGATVRVIRGAHSGRTAIVVSALPEHGRQTIRICPRDWVDDCTTGGGMLGQTAQVRPRSLRMLNTGSDSEIPFLSTIQMWPKYPLHMAAKRGDLEVCKACIDQGCAVDEVDANQGFTALHAAAQGGHIPVLKLLLDHGAEPDTGTASGGDLYVAPHGGSTALCMAALEQHQDACAYLLKRGADVHARINNGCTLVHVGAQMGNVAIVNMALDAGADPTDPMDAGLLHVGPPYTLVIALCRRPSVYRGASGRGGGGGVRVC